MLARRILAGALGLLSAAAPLSARAAPGDACVSGFEGGQEAKNQGRPLKARAELRLCVGACPELLAAECRVWLGEVEGQIGKVLLAVRDPRGRALDTAAVQIDREPAVGASVEVEPGTHVIAVAAAGYLPVERTIDVAAGAAVNVDVMLSPLPPPPVAPPEQGSTRRSVAIGLGAGGLAALLAGGGLVVFGKVEEGRLARTCSPGCDPSSVSVVEQAWIGGGAALGAGALLAGAALSLWLSLPGKNVGSASLRGWVGPSSGGGVALSGEF